MSTTYRVLVMGASYGSLLATKLLLAGHTVKLVCLPAEAELINSEGTRVRLPVKGRYQPVEIDSRRTPGLLCASGYRAVRRAGEQGDAIAGRLEHTPRRQVVLRGQDLRGRHQGHLVSVLDGDHRRLERNDGFA